MRRDETDYSNNNKKRREEFEKDVKCRGGYSDEIVVLDSGSTDATKDIVRDYGGRFIYSKWRGYSEQKNLLIDNCDEGLVLLIDADEEIDKKLEEEILRIKNSEVESVKYVYELKRATYLGKRSF